MMDLEIPLGKRTKLYRLFEILPGLASYGAIILLVVLSLINPMLAAFYLLLVILTMAIKAVLIVYHTISGRRLLDKASGLDWASRLSDLDDPAAALKRLSSQQLTEAGSEQHLENLRRIAGADSGLYPRPSQLYNAVIMPAYNESLDIIEPAIESLLSSEYDKQRLIIVFAYEERGGPDIEQAAKFLKKKYANSFYSFDIVKHPRDLPDEVVGKGSNITYAGRWLKEHLKKSNISFETVIVTTMDCDNKPHPKYFDYLTYEFISQPDRHQMSFQPVCLFTSNIWDVPAPMRVVATGNSFWNIIVSMRPHMLRNFASHAQPMDALADMDFWSVRTIVEDGHQYWRSYFHFNGNYRVLPLYVPIYQDAVLSSSYLKTLKAQFIQLRRWAYGASDVAFVGVRVFNRQRTVPFWAGMTRFFRLLDGHVTLASVAILVAVGGWVPILVNSEASRNVAALQLPDTVSVIQQVALLGLVAAVFVSFKILPPRPARYKKRRSILMVLQWALMPLVSIVYSSASAFNAQTRLMFGRYLDKFDVTDKKVVGSVDRSNNQD